MADISKPAYQSTYTDVQAQLQVVATQLSNLANTQAHLLQEAQRLGIAVPTGNTVPIAGAGTNATAPSTIIVPELASNAHSRSVALKLIAANSNVLTATQTIDSTKTIVSFTSNTYNLVPKLPVSDATIIDNPIDDHIQYALTALNSPLLEHNKRLINLNYKLLLARYSEEDLRNQLALISQAIQQTIAYQTQLNTMYGSAGNNAAPNTLPAGASQQNINLINDSAAVASANKAAAQSITVNTTQSKDQANQKANGNNPFPDSIWPQLGSSTTSLFRKKFPNFSNIFIPNVYLDGKNPQNSITIPQRWFLASVLANGQIASFPNVITAGDNGGTARAAAQAGPGYYFKNNHYGSPSLIKAFLTFVAQVRAMTNNQIVLRVSEAFPPTTRHSSHGVFKENNAASGLYQYTRPHWTGNAIDCVFEMAVQKASMNHNISATLPDTFDTLVDKLINSLRGNTSFRTIGDEYNKSTTFRTGQHIHLELNVNVNQTAATSKYDAHENLSLYALLPQQIRNQTGGWKQTKFTSVAQDLLNGTNISVAQATQQLGINSFA